MPTAAIATSTGSTAAVRAGSDAGTHRRAPRRWRSRRRLARRRAGARRRPRVRAAVLGQVRLPRQQPRHQPVADADARDHRLVLHRASADHARPARVADAALHLQRRAAAESESRSAPLRRAAVLLELGTVADDEVGHAGRLHARVHGRLVAGLSRLGRLQPQRHDEDVRDAVGPRQRAGTGRRRPRWSWTKALRRPAVGGGRGGGRRRAAAAVRVARAARPPAATTPPASAAPAATGAAPQGAPPAGAPAPRRRWRWRRAACRPDAAADRIASGIAAFRCRRACRRNFTRRNNTNYMQTGVLSALQLTSMFPNLVVENFYIEDAELDRARARTRRRTAT